VCIPSNKGNHEDAQLANNKVKFFIFFCVFCFSLSFIKCVVCVCVCVFVHKQLGRHGSNQPQGKFFLFYFLFNFLSSIVCVCVCVCVCVL
jgi:hypothetical protein